MCSHTGGARKFALIKSCIGECKKKKKKHLTIQSSGHLQVFCCQKVKISDVEVRLYIHVRGSSLVMQY
jgi:hypothetical protein